MARLVATAAAVPPLEPEVLRVGSNAFPIVPPTVLMPKSPNGNSSRFALPSITASARRIPAATSKGNFNSQLGIGVVMERPSSYGIGEKGRPYFFIHARGEPSTSVHLAFAAADRPTVDAFHRAALEAGGTDNGGPGVREQYHPTYYGAFVLDPDGNNIEAVCHTSE